MRVAFTDDGWADYCSWSDDRKMLARINRLIGEALSLNPPMDDAFRA